MAEADTAVRVRFFPKYIIVLENILIHHYYSDPTKKTERYIDIGLLGANGNLRRH